VRSFLLFLLATVLSECYSRSACLRTGIKINFDERSGYPKHNFVKKTKRTGTSSQGLYPKLHDFALGLKMNPFTEQT
jgi:hypothetical protein